MGVPIVKDAVLGEVDVDAGGAFLGDGGDEEAVAVKVLQVEGVRLGVLGVEVKHGVDQGGAVDGLLVQGGVDVVEQAVADVDGLAGALGDDGPAVELLADGGRVLVVVAEEGAEGTQGSPAGAEGLLGAAGEAANVGADHGDLEDGGEGEDLGDAAAVVLPAGDVVTEPLADGVADAGESGAGNDQGAETRAAGKHGLAGLDRHHGSIKVVDVVLGQTVLVDHVGVDSAVGDAALVGVPAIHVSGLVVDGVLGEEEITAAPAEGLAVASTRGGERRDGWDNHVTRLTTRLTLGGSADGDGLVLLAALAGVALGLEDARPAGELTRRSADGRGGRGEANGSLLGVVAGEVAREVGRFVHVDPEGIDVNTRVPVEEFEELAVPVVADVGSKPVGEGRDTGPDDTLVHGSVLAVQEDLILDALLEGRIGVIGDGGINHDDVVLVVLVERVDKLAHGGEGETLGVKREGHSAVHVVDVGPHGLERDTGLAVVVDNLSHLEGIAVTIAAVVKAETPVGHHGRESGDLGVLLSNLNGAGTGHEVEVEDTTESVVLKILLTPTILVDDDVHTVGVEEEDAVAARLAVLVVDGVVAVQVGAIGSGERVLRPHCADVVGCVEPEVVRVLAETVQVGIVGKLGAQTQVLVLEDQRRRRSVEQDLAGLGPSDGEGEGVRLVVELQVGLSRVRAGLGARTREDGLGNLVDIVLGILNLDMESVVRLISHLEDEVFEILAVGIAGTTGKLEVGSQTVAGGLNVGCLVTWARIGRVVGADGGGKGSRAEPGEQPKGEESRTDDHGFCLSC